MMKSNAISFFFVPNHRNHYRARLLHLPILAALVFFFLLLRTSFSLLALSYPAVLGYSSQITPEKIIVLTNQEREKRGLSPLKDNPLLDEAARRKAADMFAFNYWNHESPSGRKPWDFFKEVGYDYLYAGENLARDFLQPERVLEAWMASPTHRKNILNDKYQEVGVAVVNGTLSGVETTLVVQLFGAQEEGDSSFSLPPAETGKEALAVQENSLLLSSEKQVSPSPSHSKVNPLNILKLVAIFFLGALLGALVTDARVARKKGWVRLAGDNIAHISFLVFVAIIVWLTKAGVII